MLLLKIASKQKPRTVNRMILHVWAYFLHQLGLLDWAIVMPQPRVAQRLCGSWPLRRVQVQQTCYKINEQLVIRPNSEGYGWVKMRYGC